MSYRYEDLRPFVLTDEGQRKLLAMRDRARDILREAGAISWGALTAKTNGDSWETAALVDRLQELGDLKVVSQDGAMQRQIFVAAGALARSIA